MLILMIVIYLLVILIIVMYVFLNLKHKKDNFLNNKLLDNNLINNNFDNSDDWEFKNIEIENILSNKSKYKDIDELMNQTKEGETIYDVTSVKLKNK